MSSEKALPKIYDPASVEDGIYAAWEKSGLFNPDKLPGSRQRAFSVVMPPPNVTGTLHLGHAVMLAVQDLLVRFERMRGARALWLPGTDHAAIATQTKVEKVIKKKIGKTRHDLGREAFLAEVERFVRESKNTIHRQIRKMGSSCDWSREAYTLDEARTLAVRTVFKMMHDDGLIYRGNRVVNWCPRCSSTLADDEVVHAERQATLWTFRYSKDFPFAIATTRPETKLGDTAVAVNPDDARYGQYVGKTFDIDFVGQKLRLRVVADQAVDPAFGTGALGVTPAHSQIDADLARKHNLPLLQVIGEDGKIASAAKEYAGLPVEEARKKIVERLRQGGLLEKDETTTQNAATCYRCESVIEPLPKLQWFINVDKEFVFRQSKHSRIKGLRNGQKVTLKKLMQRVVRSGQIEIIPDRFVKTYFHWIDNLRDWNISRQIWFGHQVPVWYRPSSRHSEAAACLPAGRKNPTARSAPKAHLPPTNFAGTQDDEELYVGIEPPKGSGWTQDPDTLDTWFSSGLWTFSTLGWPAKTKDLKIFHPTSVMETGYDILFFWIARMILMTTYALGEIPFRTVYLHGLVRDEKGRKMSKSLGNIIDPLDVATEFGTDAVRLSLVIGTSPGADSRLWIEKIAGFRNFTNKLWNIARYILGIRDLGLGTGEAKPKTLADRWILARFAAVTKSVTDKLERFEFSSAGEELRDFTWNEFADWYLEIAKVQIANSKWQMATKQILDYILGGLLRLWHPFMPFVTEAIWQSGRKEEEKGKKGGGKEGEFLMIQDWPKTPKAKADSKTTRDFSLIQEVVTSIRNIRATQKVPPAKTVDASISVGARLRLFKEQAELIRHLARVGTLALEKKVSKPEGAAAAVVRGLEIFVSHAGEIDVEKERARLTRERENLGRYAAALESKLGNKDFAARAPASVIEAERTKLARAQEQLTKLDRQIKSLG